MRPTLATVSYGLRDLDGERVELCDECGFDAREPRDLRASLEVAYDSLRRLATHEDADRRPADEIWSGTEYGEHCVELTREIVAMVERAMGRDRSTPPRTLEEASSVARTVASLGVDDLGAPVDAWPFEISALGALVHLLHDLEHHVWDVRRGYAALALHDGIEVITIR